MPAPKKVLFVSHKANRSGAPVLLLNIIREFKKTTNVPIQVLLMEDGVLAKEFKAVGKTFTWNKKTAAKTLDANPLVRLVNRIAFVLRGTFILFKLRNTSLVFLNTITNGPMHKKLLFLKCRFICYVHELDAAINMLTNKNSLEITLNHTNLFLSVSEAVKENLICNHNVNENLIKVVASPFLENELLRNKNDYAAFVQSIKEKNKISPEAVVIGISASNEWRKGFDLFVPLVKIYFELFPGSNVYFIWKGFRNENASAWFDLYDYQRAGIDKQALLVEHGEDNIEWMAAFDIHLLLAREDPYPLVVLEAASLAIPTICFANAGGSPEFIENDCGFIVTYGDLLTMAKRIKELVGDTTMRKAMGKKAQEKLALRHSKEKAMGGFIDILKANV